jgi:NAD(P)-dependent dehydrogenase (short-subunit alcohol dehydrogenase family)
MKRFGRVLIVGGSGMLAGLGRALCERAERVSILARNEKRIRAVSDAVEPLVCDYNDGVALAEALSLIEAPDLVVAWIHGRAPQSRRAFAECLSAEGRFVQVLGSALGDPAHPERLAEMAKAADGLPIDYQAVVLGFVVENGQSRWLSNDEISAGVLSAIDSEKAVSIVGTVEPWSAKP